MSELDNIESQQVHIAQSVEIASVEDVPGGANTWGTPIGLIAWGLLLTSIKINHLYLQYILPTIGVLLFYYGSRSLRRENKWFRATWIFAIIMMARNVINLVISSTPLSKAEPDLTIFAIVYLIFQLAVLLTLKKALQTAFNKFGHQSRRNPLSWACVWTIIVLILALSASSFSLIGLFLLIWDIAIYVSLYRIGPELDEVGYHIPEPPIKMNNVTFSSAYILLLAAAVCICCVYSNHLQLESIEYQQPEMTETRARLIDMGFPAEIQKDLTDEDISVLENAVKISVSGDAFLFNSAVQQRQLPLNQASESYLFYNKRLDAVTIYIELPYKELYVLHHFSWYDGTPYWQDGFGIWAGTGREILNLKDSGLLYEKDGATYKAPVPRLQNGNITTSSEFFGTQQSNQIAGAISFPFDSQNQRGYVLYSITLPSEQTATCAAISYAHMNSPINLPYTFTEEKALNGGTFGNFMRQSYSNYEFGADSPT